MAIGFDCGTFNLVSCKRDEKGNFVYKREVNAFLELPLENRFVFNMMKTAGVPLIEREKVAYALGEAACNMTYTMSALELKRPMVHGCVNPKEKDAFQIMSIMIHSLIKGVSKDGETLYYCVPANAINDSYFNKRIIRFIYQLFSGLHTVKLILYNQDKNHLKGGGLSSLILVAEDYIFPTHPTVRSKCD